jgi:hypothetical protein
MTEPANSLPCVLGERGPIDRLLEPPTRLARFNLEAGRVVTSHAWTTQSLANRHSSRCRQIRIASLEAPFDAEAWAKVIIAFIQKDLSAGKLNLDPGRRVLHVEDVPVRHIDVDRPAPSSDPAAAEPRRPADSDPERYRRTTSAWVVADSRSLPRRPRVIHASVTGRCSLL